MKLTFMRSWLALCLLFPALPLLAQSGGANNALNNSVLIIGGVVIVAAVILLAENLIKVQARRNNVNTSRNDVPFAGIRQFFRAKPPKYSKGTPLHYLSKGFNINIEGKPAANVRDLKSNTYAVQPPNFRGIAPIPKLMVAVGDEVKAGDPVFFDKKNADILYAAPVSGEVIAINRGPKRAITEVVILADKEIVYRELPALDLDITSREDLVSYLKSSGFWPLINQRPYDIVPDPNVIPRDIFISTFVSAPQAPNMDIIIDGNDAAFQKGLDVLNLLTEGQVVLGLNGNGKNAPANAFINASGVEKHFFKGNHPSGNVGVQMHHIKPIAPGDTVWTLGVQEVVTLGKIFLERKLDGSRIIALCGAEIGHEGYIRTHLGANIGDIVSDMLPTESNTRLISGDVLTGKTKNQSQFINATDYQLTSLMEGDYFEMFGWLIPSTMRPTISRTFPNFIFPSIEYKTDTNTHGELRAFVMTGEYESVLPMDIYPQHLMKAIMAEDFEQMEGLGIHELSEADIALCEFACTSKTPLQEILREGLDYMREQG